MTVLPQTPPAPVLLEIEGLSAWRGDRELFQSLSFAVDAGELLHVHGPNGSGKSTLLRIVCGLRPADEGRMLWRGSPLEGLPPAFRAEVAYLGHSDGVKLDLSALENARLAAAIRGGEPGLGPLEALESVGLGHAVDLLARALSAGQRRRVALSALLTRRQALWVLDEPFTALDLEGAGIAAGLMAAHLGRGGAVILTSHQQLPAGLAPTRSVGLGR